MGQGCNTHWLEAEWVQAGQTGLQYLLVNAQTEIGHVRLSTVSNGAYEIRAGSWSDRVTWEAPLLGPTTTAEL